MDERTQGALLLAVGGIALRLGLTDVALAYVKTSMQPLLVLTGVVLIVLGLGSIVRAFRSPEASEEAEEEAVDHAALHGYAAVHGDGEDELATEVHEHTHGASVAWLLVLPLLALLLVAPPALGAFAAGRQPTRPPVTTQTSYPPLPDPVDGAVPLTMSEYVFRALYDDDRSLEGERIRLTGFVTPNEDGEGYLLSRFTLSCCAADATAVNVQVLGDQDWPADTWLEVEGHWRPRPDADPGVPSLDPPLLDAEASRPIDPPAQPYEY